MSAAIRAVAAALMLAVIGIPLIETWQALLLAVCVLALVFGSVRPGIWRLAAAAAIALAVIGVTAILPRANIAEAHNAFLVIRDGEPLERGLPGDVFRSWKAQLDARYPPDAHRDADPHHWRHSENVPRTLFTESADAIWRIPKYTRQVDAIGFTSLREFRGGFSNEARPDGTQYVNAYNFWIGPMQREWMPFYVMYQLTRATAGSQIVWKGQVFWERSDHGFDEIVHPSVAARRIEAEDAGRRIYAAFFPGPIPDLYFALEPSLTLRLAGWFDALFRLAGALFIAGLIVRPRWPDYLRTLALFGIGYSILTTLNPSAFPNLGRLYGPFRGGDDGMLHDGYGRAMAMVARRGDVVEALKGAEPVYWFTPGMRYFRMGEKFIFGDTNHLHALAVAALPVVLFYLVRALAGNRWAWITTAIFCLMPIGNLSFLQYIAYANAGYGEAVAAGLFLLGLTLLFRTQPAWRGMERSGGMASMAGAALAAAMFIRPNLALAVVWIGAAYGWASLRRRDWRLAAALACGLGFALWMPLHNVVYGRELYLISKAGSTVSLPIGVGDYAAAFGDVTRGRFDTQRTRLIAAQLEGWLIGSDDGARRAVVVTRVAHAIRLLALAVTCWVAVRWLVGRVGADTDVGVLAIAAICAHIPMLFLYSTAERYAVLAWDLSLIVMIVAVARRQVWI